MDSTSVILLGTGTPYPSSRAQDPATAVSVGDRLFVFDAGGGVERQMEAAGLPARHEPHDRAQSRSVVISGDTRPSDSLEAAARGVNILIHEVYPESRLQPEARPGGEDGPKYMRSYHTSDRELGELAARAEPGKLVLHHIVRMGGTDEELLNGVRLGGFHGELVIGRDLEKY